MAKDPAFLFYPNDYLGGTMGMTFEEKGAYMELLMLQFNRGHMTTHMIGQIVGQIWDNIKDKFIQDEKGLWYNKRLEEEQEKRKNFTKSRRNNVKGVNQHTKKDKKETKKVGRMTKHTGGRMENEDEDVNVIKVKDEIAVENKKRKTEKLEIIYPFDSAEFMVLWNNWKIYKRDEFGFKYKSSQSEQAALQNLANKANGNDRTACLIIKQSLENGWKGFFELKNNKEDAKDKFRSLAEDYLTGVR